MPELSKTLKSMGLPSKAASASKICWKDKNEIVFDETKNVSIFQSFCTTVAQNLVSKLPSSPNIFTESKVASYCYNIKFEDKVWIFWNISLNNIKYFDSNLSKTAGIDNL